MGNKIITEKDFWICTQGTTPAQLQSRQTPKLVKKESGPKYITVADTATSSWIDFGCKKLMLIMAILAAVVVVFVVATGGAGLAALIAAGAIAGAAGAAFGAAVGMLICGQKAAAMRKWLSSKPDMIIKGQQAITGDDKMKCMIFDADITFAPHIKNWWQAIALGASNYIGGILEGMMYGAAIGAAGGIISGGPAVLSQFGVSNVAANWLATWGGWGLGLRGAITAQSVLGAYGEKGEVSTGDVIYHGVFGMETGTLHSAQNILSGNGTMTDFIGVALWFTPAHARNQKSRTISEESRTRSEEGRNEEGGKEENPQARTGESKTPRKQGEFEAFEEGKKTEPPKKETPPESFPVCFVAGTPVQTPNGPVPIEALDRGQLVLAKGEGQSIGAYRVLDYTHGMTRKLYHIEVGGSYQCTTTRNHPFFVAGKGWTIAHKIEIGDGLIALDGAIVPVTALDHERLIDPVDTFNIHVEDVSTYFVGGGLAVWVHNADPSAPVYNEQLYWGFGASGPRQRLPDPNNPDRAPDFDGASSWRTNSPDEVGRFMGVRAAGNNKGNHGAVSQQQLADKGLVAVETPGNNPAMEAAGLKHYSIRPATNPDPNVPLTETEMRFVDSKLNELKGSLAAKAKPSEFGCG